MKLFTTKQIAQIITGIKTFTELQLITDYILQNGVAIINNYGAAYYNSIAFAIQEKTRQLENIKV